MPAAWPIEPAGSRLNQFTNKLKMRLIKMRPRRRQLTLASGSLMLASMNEPKDPAIAHPSPAGAAATESSEAGALVVAAFPKPKDGSGFPARVFAILP